MMNPLIHNPMHYYSNFPLNHFKTFFPALFPPPSAFYPPTTSAVATSFPPPFAPRTAVSRSPSPKLESTLVSTVQEEEKIEAEEEEKVMEVADEVKDEEKEVNSTIQEDEKVNESDVEEPKTEEIVEKLPMATQPSRPSLSSFVGISSHLVPSESVYESAAKLLFMSIKWAKSVPSFLQLQESDQTLLLEESWAQLFIIGLAQWAIRFDENNLVRESFAAREDFPKLSADAKHLKDVTSKLVNLRLDHTEFTCLKALALFKPDVCGLRNHVQVEVLQDQTHLMLQEYCNSKAQVSSGKLRFGKILLTMPIISQVI